MIPTSIDGTDITGATIDGTDVTEITVDGQTVFSAQTLPVAYSNLVAWYPFDSATYGGSNADDVTAIIGGSGDDTAYNGTVNGATYQSSGGVTDINAGANSGGFDLDGSNDLSEITNMDNFNFAYEFTFSLWANYDTIAEGGAPLYVTTGGGNISAYIGRGVSASGGIDFGFDDGSSFSVLGFTNQSTGQWTHLALTWDGSTVTAYKDASSVGTISRSSWESSSDNNFDYYIGRRLDLPNFLDGTVDDLRLYDTALTTSQVNQIYNNTDPN